MDQQRTPDGMPNAPVAKLAYSVEETAAHLDLCREHVHRLIKAGALRSFKIGKRRLISHEALTAYITDAEDAERDVRHALTPRGKRTAR